MNIWVASVDQSGVPCCELCVPCVCVCVDERVVGVHAAESRTGPTESQEAL